MADTFVIGVDFGTESGRALLVNTETGEEVAASSHQYAHGVMDQYLPDGTPLQENWALQHPSDYLEVLRVTVRNVLQQANVHPANVIGLGIDFTSCTMLPLTKQGEPLCLQSKYATRPHSWVKLWKHHAAHREAEYVTDVAKERGEGFLNRYGGKISSEWMIPKILQIINEDKDVYEQADLFMEAGDWLVYKMTGNLIRSSNTCGYKALWNKKEGYPDNDFFKALHPDMENIIETKLRGSITSIGEKAGELTAEMAEFIGLEPRTAVAVNVIDAHAVLPAVGAVNPGQMVMAIGTSTCHMLISDKEKYVPGVCGMVEDGIIPGYVSYETGQVAVGDSFAWLVENSVPVHSYEEAKKKGMSIHAYLEEKAAQLTPGASGLIALDWWNGNRSVLVDANLTGALIGLKLSTTPEEIYRALIESTAFGTRKIIETFHNENVPVTEIFVCGGIPQKNKLLIQIYADVLNREIKVANSQEITAYGAAMYAATAAGANKGGFDSIFTAAKKMAKVKDESFYPIEENVQMYNELYEIYVGLHDFFGIDRSDLMHKLNQICLQ